MQDLPEVCVIEQEMVSCLLKIRIVSPVRNSRVLSNKSSSAKGQIETISLKLYTTTSSSFIF